MAGQARDAAAGQRTQAGPRRDYLPDRFTLKSTALDVPSAVATVTSTTPRSAVLGTLHVILSSLQDLYVVNGFPPNCKAPPARVAPKPAPEIVTSVPRLPEPG